MSNQSGKVALITGASSGIGKAAAFELKNKGFTVYAAARRLEPMEELKKSGINTLSLDVTDEKSVESVIEHIISTSGRIDVLINNAGYAVYGAVEDIPIDIAKKQFDVNLFGLSFLVQQVLPYMRAAEQGTIINISSIGGKIYSPYGAYYHASKFAVEGYSDCLRYELKPFNIKVVLIEPGIIKTEWQLIAAESLNQYSGNGAYASGVAEYSNYMKKMYANNRASSPMVIARLIARIARKSNPKPRYAAGRLSSTALISRKILPDRLFDYILRLQIKLISKN